MVGVLLAQVDFGTPVFLFGGLKSFCVSQSIVLDMMVLRCAVEAMWAVGLDMAEAVALVASLLSVDS